MQNSCIFFLLVSVLCILGCKPNPTEQNSPDPAPVIDYPTAFLQGLDAHGGLDTWKKQGSLQYSFVKNNKKETQTIDLISRQCRIDYPDWNIGFDGQEVWVTPKKEAFGSGSPRFYHNLYFYFFAMPFVLADPGIQYEVLEKDSLNGQLYTPVKIQFDQGVGDAPKDEYIAYFDVNNHRLGALLYTVTYYSGRQGTRFNALIYDNWVEINGLLLPASLKGYTYENEKIGDKRYELQFENITIHPQRPDPALFMRPKGAEVDSLIKH